MKQIISVGFSAIIVIVGLQLLSQDHTVKNLLPKEMDKPSFFNEAQLQRVQSRGGEVDPM